MQAWKRSPSESALKFVPRLPEVTLSAARQLILSGFNSSSLESKAGSNDRSSAVKSISVADGISTAHIDSCHAERDWLSISRTEQSGSSCRLQCFNHFSKHCLLLSSTAMNMPR